MYYFCQVEKLLYLKSILLRCRLIQSNSYELLQSCSHHQVEELCNNHSEMSVLTDIIKDLLLIVGKLRLLLITLSVHVYRKKYGGARLVHQDKFV